MLKNQKGITLIALVITIIVLLILAGVSIAMLTGPNGLLTRAGNAKDDTLKAEAVEKANMEAQAQLTNALAGRVFDSVDDITANLNSGKSDGITYNVTVNDSTGVTITISAPTGLTKNTAEVKKVSNNWTFEAAKK